MITKLTADKARERIAHLTAWREQRGLTLREEEYLEAMQLALILLTAEPIGQVMFGGHDSQLMCPDASVVCLDDEVDWSHFPEGTFLYLLESN